MRQNPTEHVVLKPNRHRCTSLSPSQIWSRVKIIEVSPWILVLRPRTKPSWKHVFHIFRENSVVTSADWVRSAERLLHVLQYIPHFPNHSRSYRSSNDRIRICDRDHVVVPTIIKKQRCTSNRSLVRIPSHVPRKRVVPCKRTHCRSENHILIIIITKMHSHIIEQIQPYIDTLVR